MTIQIVQNDVYVYHLNRFIENKNMFLLLLVVYVGEYLMIQEVGALLCNKTKRNTWMIFVHI